jgi:hypothetical protein
MPSLACSAGISQLKFGTDRIGFGITRELFLSDADSHFAGLQNYREPELDTSASEPTQRDSASASKRRISG